MTIEDATSIRPGARLPFRMQSTAPTMSAAPMTSITTRLLALIASEVARGTAIANSANVAFIAGTTVKCATASDASNRALKARATASTVFSGRDIFWKVASYKEPTKGVAFVSMRNVPRVAEATVTLKPAPPLIGMMLGLTRVTCETRIRLSIDTVERDRQESQGRA